MTKIEWPLWCVSLDSERKPRCMSICCLAGLDPRIPPAERKCVSLRGFTRPWLLRPWRYRGNETDGSLPLRCLEFLISSLFEIPFLFTWHILGWLLFLLLVDWLWLRYCHDPYPHLIITFIIIAVMMIDGSQEATFDSWKLRFADCGWLRVTILKDAHFMPGRRRRRGGRHENRNIRRS